MLVPQITTHTSAVRIANEDTSHQVPNIQPMVTINAVCQPTCIPLVVDTLFTIDNLQQQQPLSYDDCDLIVHKLQQNNIYTFGQHQQLMTQYLGESIDISKLENLIAYRQRETQILQKIHTQQQIRATQAIIVMRIFIALIIPTAVLAQSHNVTQYITKYQQSINFDQYSYHHTWLFACKLNLITLKKLMQHKKRGLIILKAALAQKGRRVILNSMDISAVKPKIKKAVSNDYINLATHVNYHINENHVLSNTIKTRTRRIANALHYQLLQRVLVYLQKEMQVLHLVYRKRELSIARGTQENRQQASNRENTLPSAPILARETEQVVPQPTII